MDANAYCRQLLEQIQLVNYDLPISDAIADAVLSTPRHLFVRRFRFWGTKQWHEVTPENVGQYLATLYTNRTVILFGDDDNDVPSTISQPDFVIRMLHLLDVRPGHRVFELGTGSGWNAALLAHLAGQDGHVYSMELIPELAHAAAENLRALGVRNIDILPGDGGDGYASGAPYDRAVFTAGSYDVPRSLHEQIASGGLLLMVVKNVGGGDCLFLLRKEDDHFASVDAMPCGFVQLRGKYRIEDLEPITIETLPEWEKLRRCEISRTPFWWGWKGKDPVAWRTFGIRSFLGIVEPTFRAFKALTEQPPHRKEYYFGLWLPGENSLVLVKDDQLISYGSDAAKAKLCKQLRFWFDLGMPSAASLTLRVYPSDTAVACGENDWVVKRKGSQFVWSVPKAISSCT